ncbi:MAG: acetyl-CoA carboxylase biotin carboxyl carrier protein [Chlamydiales bacterium]
MDFEEIDELMSKMQDKGIKRLHIKREGFELELEREGVHCVMTSHPPLAIAPPHVAAASAPEIKKIHGHAITSPIVGTFYMASSPEDPPYVKVGQMVEPSSVVCIIEAMKVMNEVKAGVQGKVVEILVKNGDPVEYGTEMIRVELS